LLLVEEEKVRVAAKLAGDEVCATPVAATREVVMLFEIRRETVQAVRARVSRSTMEG